MEITRKDYISLYLWHICCSYRFPLIACLKPNQVGKKRKYAEKYDIICYNKIISVQLIEMFNKKIINC